jgi:hypothetical protein
VREFLIEIHLIDNIDSGGIQNKDVENGRRMQQKVIAE